MNINYKSPLVLFVFFATVCSIYSQQDAQYTQYMYNTVTVNPAYTGTRGMLSVVGLHRTQWVGVEGAPSTQTLSIHSPIGISKVGLGGSIINDEIGPVNETYFDATFSYTIPTSEIGKLSFGLKAGARLFNVNFNELNRDTDDLAFANNIDNQFNPSVGAGVYYHNQRFYIGLSVPNILETEHLEASDPSNLGAASSVAKERLNFYLIVGHTFDLTDDIKFKPAILGKLVSGAPLQVDASANFLFYEKLTLGLAYRWSAALSAMAAFQISDSLLIGLAYDRETTELAELNDGSFEVMLRFELFKKYDRLLTPRFF